MIDVFRSYTPKETCSLIDCNMEILLPILKKMSKKSRCGVREKGETYLIGGGEVKVIKYRLEHE